jgi:hypothetical protein
VASIEISLTTPIEVLPGERKIKPPGRCLEHTNTFGYDFATDAITFDYRDPIRFQLFPRRQRYLPS